MSFFVTIFMLSGICTSILLHIVRMDGEGVCPVYLVHITPCMNHLE